jgi:formate dehydrogenase major subunit
MIEDATKGATQEKRLLNTPHEVCADIVLILDGASVTAGEGELLVDAINRNMPNRHLAQVCYHPQLGPIESCDTCLVEVDGKLKRACATHVAAGMQVETASERAQKAQREAFDRILKNHDLY